MLRCCPKAPALPHADPQPDRPCVQPIGNDKALKALPSVVTAETERTQGIEMLSDGKSLRALMESLCLDRQALARRMVRFWAIGGDAYSGVALVSR